MARSLFSIEKGLRIYKANSDSQYFDFLFGSAAPVGGDAGELDAAPIGALYARSNGTLYQKINNAANSSDWELNGVGTTSVVPVFKNYRVVAATGEALTAGTRDLSTTPFTDDQGTTLAATDFAVDDYIIGGVGGTPVLYKVTAVASPNITFAAATPALADNDGFVVKNYLPDSPADQENMALVVYSAGAIVKLADVDWSIATGINLSSVYGASVGNVLPSDSVETAIAKLDGVNDAQDTALGLAQGATDFGSLNGPLAQNDNAKNIFNSIGTEFTNVDTRLDVLEITTVKYDNWGVVPANTATNIAPASTKLYSSVKYFLTVYLSADKKRKKAMEIHAVHNGDGTTDATLSDFDVVSKLKVGTLFDFSVDVVFSGSGVNQMMELQVLSTQATYVDVHYIAVTGQL